MDQIDLFGHDGAPPELREEAGPRTPRRGPRHVGPAYVDDELRHLGSRIPSAIRLGTSSWSFPGWAGIVYDRPASATTLARHGLAAYARHPLLRTAGVDRSYYRSLEVEVWRRYAAAVPDDFRFLAKAERVLVRPDEALFLDPGYAAEVVVGPFADGLGPKAGPLLFQFPPLRPGEVGGPRRFAEGLYRFLDGLPPGLLYAVEIRTPELLTDDYAAALRHGGAVHGYVVHPRMASLERQLDLLPPGPGPLVLRWMLHAGFAYEEARDLYEPFDRLVDPDPATRRTVAAAAREVAATGGEAWIVVNNKAEGSSPLSVEALARELAAAGEEAG